MPNTVTSGAVSRISQVRPEQQDDAEHEREREADLARARLRLAGSARDAGPR